MNAMNLIRMRYRLVAAAAILTLGWLPGGGAAWAQTRTVSLRAPATHADAAQVSSDIATAKAVSNAFRAAAELGGPFACFTIERGKGRVVGVEGEHLLRFMEGGDHVLVLFLVTDRDSAIVAVEQEAHTRRPPLHRSDGRDTSHAVEDVRRDVLAVFPL